MARLLPIFMFQIFETGIINAFHFTCFYLTFSGGIEKDHGHEMGLTWRVFIMSFIRTYGKFYFYSSLV